MKKIFRVAKFNGVLASLGLFAVRPTGDFSTGSSRSPLSPSEIVPAEEDSDAPARAGTVKELLSELLNLAAMLHLLHEYRAGYQSAAGDAEREALREGLSNHIDRIIAGSAREIIEPEFEDTLRAIENSMSEVLLNNLIDRLQYNLAQLNWLFDHPGWSDSAVHSRMQECETNICSTLQCIKKHNRGVLPGRELNEMNRSYSC